MKNYFVTDIVLCTYVLKLKSMKKSIVSIYGAKLIVPTYYLLLLNIENTWIERPPCRSVTLCVPVCAFSNQYDFRDHKSMSHNCIYVKTDLMVMNLRSITICWFQYMITIFTNKLFYLMKDSRFHYIRPHFSPWIHNYFRSAFKKSVTYPCLYLRIKL